MKYSDQTPLHTPTAERERLLAKLLEGPQSVLGTYAIKFIFPDIVMTNWCRQRSIELKLEKIQDRSAVMNHREYVFYNFRIISDDEL